MASSDRSSTFDLQRLKWKEWKGKTAELFIVTDRKTGFQVTVSDFGATLVDVRTPDRNGDVDRISYGQDDPALYSTLPGYFGATVGRVANRIAHGKFTLNRKEYSLICNNNNLHSIHGGKEGFNVKHWTCLRFEELPGNEQYSPRAIVQFEYISPDLEENYPETLHTVLTYELKKRSAPSENFGFPWFELSWEFRSKIVVPTSNIDTNVISSDRGAGGATLINLTNHAYWNLDGLGGTIDDHLLQVAASVYMPVDAACLVTGEMKKISQSPLGNLHVPQSFREIFAKFGDLDNCFWLDRQQPMNIISKRSQGQEEEEEEEKQTGTALLYFAAKLQSLKSGRVMQVYTSEPCLQVYSGNFLDPKITHCFGGQPCIRHGAVCLETQRPPNAINLPEFADMIILKEGQEYYHKTLHRFGIATTDTSNNNDQ